MKLELEEEQILVLCRAHFESASRAMREPSFNRLEVAEDCAKRVLSLVETIKDDRMERAKEMRESLKNYRSQAAVHQ